MPYGSGSYGGSGYASPGVPPPLPPPEPGTTRLSVAAYDRVGALLVELDHSYARTWQDQLNDTGTGNLALQNDDPDLALVAYSSVVRFLIDGLARFAMLVERKERTTISPTEEVDEATAVSGRGTLAIFEEAVVLPPAGVNRPIFTDRRVFNFASGNLDDSAWPAAVASPMAIDPLINFRFPSAVDACLAPGGGLWVAGSDGGVGTYHGAGFFGSMGGVPLAASMTAIAARDPYGYWLCSEEGGVFAFGSAVYYGNGVGSVTGVAIAIERSTFGNGYWLICSDGRILPFGDAAALGSSPGVAATGPVDACLAPGGGVWVAGFDGGVYAYGADYHGSLPDLAIVPAAEIAAIVPHGPGGYWLVGADTGVFAFGDAPARFGYGAMIDTEWAAGTRAIVAAELTGPASFVMIADDGATYASSETAP